MDPLFLGSYGGRKIWVETGRAGAMISESASGRDLLFLCFFGQGFRMNSLPKSLDIESIPKNEIYQGLKNATSACKTKARYGKGEHSFKLLQVLSPQRVRDASPWARRFLDQVEAITQA